MNLKFKKIYDSDIKFFFLSFFSLFQNIKLTRIERGKVLLIQIEALKFKLSKHQETINSNYSKIKEYE